MLIKSTTEKSDSLKHISRLYNKVQQVSKVARTKVTGAPKQNATVSTIDERYGSKRSLG